MLTRANNGMRWGAIPDGRSALRWREPMLSTEEALPIMVE